MDPGTAGWRLSEADSLLLVIGTARSLFYSLCEGEEPLLELDGGRWVGPQFLRESCQRIVVETLLLHRECTTSQAGSHDS